MMYNDQEGKKWIQNPKKRMLLGYVDGENGYRLWDPTVHKVIITRDVISISEKLRNNNTTSKEEETINGFRSQAINL